MNEVTIDIDKLFLCTSFRAGIIPPGRNSIAKEFSPCVTFFGFNCRDRSATDEITIGIPPDAVEHLIAALIAVKAIVTQMKDSG